MHTRRDLIAGTLAVAGATALPGIIPAKAATPYTSLRDRLAGDLETYAAFGSKVSGSTGDIATAEWIQRRLSTFGYNTRTSAFPVPYFETARAELRLQGHTIKVAPHAVVVPTPEKGVTAPGVLIRSMHDRANISGRIAFVILPYGRHAAIFSSHIKPLVDRAAQNGAAAIVVVPTGPTGEIVYLNTRLTPVAPMPIALMAPRDLSTIEQAVENGENLTLQLSGMGEIRQSCNVIAERRAGPNWLVFSTPRSGWGICAGERGPGTAIFLEMCRWAAQRYPDHSIFALNSGGHELDFAGTHHSMHEAPPPESTLLWTHLGAGLATRDAVEVVRSEMVMTSSADPQRVLMTSSALLEKAKVAFAGLTGYDQPIEVVGGAGELSSIIDRGYTKAFAGLGIHRWCHVESDTMERVDVELLVPVYEAHKALVEMEAGTAS